MNFTELTSQADAVVFDLGAVILNIDPQQSVNQFSELGIPDLFGFLFGTEEHQYFEDFERGRYTPAQFRQHVAHSSGIAFSDETFDAAFNAMLLDYPAARVQAVQRCAQSKPTFLLSNTNEIHYQHYAHRLGHCGVGCLDDLFREAFFSQRVGMRKPDDEIYQYVIGQIGLPAHKILFLDDNARNIEAAKRNGISTIHITGGLDIADIFK